MLDLTHAYGKLKRQLKGYDESDLKLVRIETHDQFMYSVTRDLRWKYDSCFESGPFTTIILPPNDPAAYATMYAISQLEGCKKSQEEFDPVNGTVYSGASKLCVQTPKGYIEATGWLTPLTTRFPENKQYLTSTFKGVPILDNVEINVIGDLDFMKENHAQLKDNYAKGLAFAKTNKLDANSIFKDQQKSSRGAHYTAT